MQERIAFKRIAPEGLEAMGHLEACVRRCGLEPSLLELVKLRASQINGCTYSIDMPTKRPSKNYFQVLAGSCRH